MSQLLASDMNNPDFAGASNPDSRLAVRFYARPVRHEFRSIKEGRPIFIDMDYIEIMVPGDATSTIDRPIREEDKARWPLHWAHYMNKHGGDPKEIGTPLEQWPRLSRAQVEELKALKFFTVENIAGASDQNLGRIGMIAGMAPHALKDAAIRFLSVAKDDAVATAAAETAQKAEERAKALEEDNAKMRAEFEEKLAAMQALVAQATAPKKRGRPKKEA